jgi:hypothetical protein
MNVKIQLQIIVHKYVLIQKVVFDVNVLLVLNPVELIDRIVIQEVKILFDNPDKI